MNDPCNDILNWVARNPSHKRVHQIKANENKMKNENFELNLSIQILPSTSVVKLQGTATVVVKYSLD